MASRNVFIRIFLFSVMDITAINGALNLLFIGLQLKEVINVNPYFYLLINITWLLSAIINKLYRTNNVQAMGRIWSKTLLTFSCQIVFIGLAASWLKNMQLSQLFCIYSLLTELVALSIVRVAIYLTEVNYRQLHSFKSTVAVIGCDEASAKVARYLKKNRIAFNFTTLYKQSDNFEGPHAERERYELQLAIEDHLDELYMTMPTSDDDYFASLITLAEQHCVKLRFITTFSELEKSGTSDYHLSGFCDGIPILTNRPEPLNTLNNRILKRLFDIVFSSFIIVFILSWLTPLIAILIKLESPGPIIFKQLRSGRNNKPFWCYKFRSMTVNDQSNMLQASKNDSRVTKMGAILRKTSIDELPQFFNVLLGNMSVVGPRPHMISHTDQYRLVIEQYMMRLFTKPGITGWAQVNGYRGETKDREQMLHRVDHDIWYLENWSIVKDLKITYKTFLNAVQGDVNAY
jgi:putative colanic acid biosynthesis UDP-glucose lipid carrier transferase